MSLAYLKEHIDFKLFFDLVKKLNLLTTHDTGFHIHVNIKPTLRERNLILRLFSLSYPLWLMLSERKIIRLQNRYVSTEFFMMSDRIKRRHQTNLKNYLKHKSHMSHFKIYILTTMISRIVIMQLTSPIRKLPSFDFLVEPTIVHLCG